MVKHVKKVLIILAVIFGLLLVGVVGCTALIGGAVNEVAEDIEEKENAPGGKDNPLTVKPGKAFEIRQLNYQAGWTIGKDVLGSVEVRNLKVTNNREGADEAFIEIKLWKGTEVLALADCSTEQIAPGTTTTLNCLSADDFPASYDKVTVNDTF